MINGWKSKHVVVRNAESHCTNKFRGTHVANKTVKRSTYKDDLRSSHAVLSSLASSNRIWNRIPCPLEQSGSKDVTAIFPVSLIWITVSVLVVVIYRLAINNSPVTINTCQARLGEEYSLDYLPINFYIPQFPRKITCFSFPYDLLTFHIRKSD